MAETEMLVSWAAVVTCWPANCPLAGNRCNSWLGGLRLAGRSWINNLLVFLFLCHDRLASEPSAKEERCRQPAKSCRQCKAKNDEVSPTFGVLENGRKNATSQPKYLADLK
ncbi:hypothetical protein Salat_2659800 [Sesamum alatum]|uniref:Uncharacterized protein n=1 Tax=Sesamum alatum TaxID=300844 RepID=A0AAE1XPA1_9LAMI|nr:hypothetical protein Salat_2659800 [Sesamum alatum]